MIKRNTCLLYRLLLCSSLLFSIIQLRTQRTNFTVDGNLADSLHSISVAFGQISLGVIPNHITAQRYGQGLELIYDKTLRVDPNLRALSTGFNSFKPEPEVRCIYTETISYYNTLIPVKTGRTDHHPAFMVWVNKSVNARKLKMGYYWKTWYSGLNDVYKIGTCADNFKIAFKADIKDAQSYFDRHWNYHQGGYYCSGINALFLTEKSAIIT